MDDTELSEFAHRYFRGSAFEAEASSKVIPNAGGYSGRTEGFSGIFVIIS